MHTIQATLHHIAPLAIVAVLFTGCGNTESSAEETAQAEAAAAPVPDVADTRPNAADNYRRIHERMGQGYFEPMVNFDPDNPPTAAETAFLNSQQDLVRDIIAASKIERCDFEPDYNQGVDMLLPHLAWMRHCCMLLRDDAGRFIQQPSGQSGAADRMAACVRIGKQLGSEPLVISKLVGISCVSVCSNFVNKRKDRLTDPQARATIRKELETVRGSALFDVRPALKQELAAAKITLGKGDAVEIEGQKIQMSQQERAAILSELESAFAQMDKAWGAPDAESQFKKILDSLRNPQSNLFVGAFDMFVRQMNRAQTELNAAIAALK